MEKKNILFSHKSDEWETPLNVFEPLEKEFGDFDFDVSATKHNTKCNFFFSKEEDSLSKKWGRKNWCNPPYSQVNDFAQKALNEQQRGNMTVMLIPARTDTRFFHDYIYNKPDVEIRFVKGRIKFISPDGSLLRGIKMNGSNNAAPFASMVVFLHIFSTTYRLT